MITTLNEINEILDENPDIPLSEFWPSVGVEPEAALDMVAQMARLAGVNERTAGGLLESGATLAKAGLEQVNESTLKHLSDHGYTWEQRARAAEARVRQLERQADDGA
jgi:hypothetical protein